ncbi:hypothetical protein [Nocardia transvalensis]|uniref:hypothetical protein n=1 Tax=Nocardia transvalensis TaxID=37333 RepID=UPI001893D20C|nr:hypothetical protein [Nocardia transvalensis]MBF6333324.1 hypothetical protein [Nocardia transvalensis]
MTEQLINVAALESFVRTVAGPNGVGRDELKELIREVLAECAVDTQPYSYSTESAQAATGLSKWRINELIRTDQIAVRQEGAKNLIVGSSLRRYIDSLPARGTG